MYKNLEKSGFSRLNSSLLLRNTYTKRSLYDFNRFLTIRRIGILYTVQRAKRCLIRPAPE